MNESSVVNGHQEIDGDGASSKPVLYFFHCFVQKQPSRGVLRKRCSENMQQIYRRAPMPKCDINKVDLQHIFRTPFPKNTSGRLLQISEILLTGKKNLGPKSDLNV